MRATRSRTVTQNQCPQGHDGARMASPDQRASMPSFSSPSVSGPFPVKAFVALTCIGAGLLTALVVVPSRVADPETSRYGLFQGGR